VVPELYYAANQAIKEAAEIDLLPIAWETRE
jgi:hypothetical protein